MTEDTLEELLDSKIPTEFPDWFREYVRNPINNVTCIYLKALAEGPFKKVYTFPGYIVNGLRFHTTECNTAMATSNSGVCVNGAEEYGDATLFDFHGKLKRIVRIEYSGLPFKRTFLFDVEWYDPNPGGTRKNERFEMVDVNQKKRYRTKYEPFILATQARQVVFLEYPSRKRDKGEWLAAVPIRARSKVEYIEKDDSITNSYQQEDVDKQAEDPIEADDELFDLHEDQYVDLEDGDNGILCVL